MLTKKKTVFYTFIFFILIALLIFLYKPINYYINNFNEFKLLLKEHSITALFIIYLLQILQVVIAFIPSDFINLSAGYILGAPIGFIVSYLGLVSGTILAFYIARYFGKSIVTKLVNKDIRNW